MVGNVPDAQDVYQEALLAAFQGLPRFRMDSVFSTWLYRIAANKALRFRGRRQRRRAVSTDLPILGQAGHNDLTGDLNGGGASFFARTAAGDITLAPR